MFQGLLAAIPYFRPPPFKLGPFTIEPFGVFVAAGVLLGAQLAMRAAKSEGKNPKVMADFAFWGLIAGVVFGHWVHLFLYHPEELSRGPLQIFKVWDGLSSFGGLLGGIIAAAVFFKLRGERFDTYADALALGIAPGWAVSRLGCFAVHDHPGIRSDFFLAVDFPGGARHDLGLYDALFLFALSALLWAVRKRSWAKGRLLPLLAALYGVGRFGFDFLRATDVAYADARYWGLTPAQYACVGLWVYAAVKARPGQLRPERRKPGVPHRF